jgi:bifunctional DNA-binding transcriptional regulator/antitoxin component of YhaV-PrlF toxin-antitoxin module
MNKAEGTAIIRDRGQLTIPEKIRKALKWSHTNSVVSLTATSNDELIIKPYKNEEKTDWERIWLDIDLSRSYKSKKGNLAKFIVNDRENH